MKRPLYGIALLALLAFAAGVLANPAAAWGAWLVGAWLTLGLGLSGALLVAMLYASGAGWGVVIRSVPEQMGRLIPLGGLLLLVSLLGAQALYPWSRPEVVAADPLIAGKAGWLNVPLVAVRALLFVGLWAWLARGLARAPKVEDPLQAVRRKRRLSAVLLITFAFGFTLLSVDWILSLQPTFYSTVFMLYVFCGIMLSGVALGTIVVITLRRGGRLPGVHPDHLQDLGKLVMMFATLWAYMWLSQYLLIWYTNIPEEIVFYTARTRGVWGMLWIPNLVLNWVLPFLILLPRAAKRSERVLLAVCWIVLAGQGLDVLHLVLPALEGVGGPVGIGAVTLLVPLGGPALFATLLLGKLERNPSLIPDRDPLILESLHHHQ